MSAPFFVHMMGVVPIPVGHRVEVRVVCRDVAVFGTKLEPQPLAPLVVDLDTGIVYGESWHFQEISMYQPGIPRLELPMVPRHDLREAGRWHGRVTATRVAWIGGGASSYPQTSLAIAPEEAPAAYR
jgi:hypothetical protein